MIASHSRLDLADWNRREPEFGALREYDDGRRIVVAPYKPAGDWLALRDQWLDLPPHPHLLDAVDVDGDALLLRYAAIDWHHPPIQLAVNRRAHELVAEWGVQLVDVFGLIIAHAPEPQRFLGAVTTIDLGRAARISFAPVPARECSDRAVIEVIGTMLQNYCCGLATEAAAPIRNILDRCTDPEPFQTLSELRTACMAVVGRAPLRAAEKLASWSLAEEGLGWLALSQPTAALELFDAALELDRYLDIAEHGRRRALAALGVVSGTTTARERKSAVAQTEAKVKVSWSQAEEQGRAFEATRGFREALAHYHEAAIDGTSDVFIYTAIARCYLALGEAGRAVDYAQQALAVRSKHVEALSIRARGYVIARRHEDALKSAGVWLVAAPDDPSAHYTCGRALLALRRFFEARDAFDRACMLQPNMLEAMLLRREAERAARQVREDVGVQPAIEVDLPDHLAELRPLLAAGNLEDVIAALAAHDTDADAKLVHARCLAFMNRNAEAVEVFERVVVLAPRHEGAARIGQAHALLGLDKAHDALAIFDRVIAHAPADLEALEGRALALRQLGRDADADVAFSKVVAASGVRSELRVGRPHR